MNNQILDFTRIFKLMLLIATGIISIYLSIKGFNDIYESPFEILVKTIKREKIKYSPKKAGILNRLLLFVIGILALFIATNIFFDEFV